MKTFVVLLSLLLAGCATPAAVSVCPVARQWTDSEQDRILQDFKKLPSDSALIPVVVDYERIRAQLKDCKGAV